MRLRSIVTIAIWVAALSGLSAGYGRALAQAPPPAPAPPATATRPGGVDQPRPSGTSAIGGAPTRTAIIRGRVITAEGAPLRRAQVTLRVAAGPARESLVVSTDEQGRYEIPELPAGRHTLSAAKTGYLTLSYGQRRPLDEPRPLEIVDGQTLDRVDFILPRGGVIVARIRDDLGEPVGGVFVQAEYYGFSGGQRRLTSAGSTRTDDTGEARLSGLPPGEYFVSADSNFGGGASSPVLGVSDSGRRYTLTYNPGTMTVAEAQSVAVGIGQEASVVFPLVAARAARISGVVRNSNGGPPGRVSLSLQRMITNGGTTSDAPMQADGTFSIADLLPGEYVLGLSTSQTARGADLSTEHARLALTISGVDQTGLVLSAVKGAVLHGQVVFDTATAAPSGLRPSAVTIVPSLLANANLSLGRLTMNDDWTFDLADVAGTGFLRLRGPVNGWLLKAVMLDGKDVTDTPLEFAGDRAFKDLQIVLTQKRTEVAGGVVDSRGAPTSEYVAVVFGEERDQWSPQSRYIATGRPDQQGQFKITGLPPGRYLAAALDYLPTGQERDPALLDRLQATASRITLVEGGPTAVSLKLTAY